VVGGRPGESSEAVSRRVVAARARAADRGVRCNAQLRSADLERHAPFAPDTADRLESLLRDNRLSARGLQRVRRVALTLADLAGDSPPLRTDHLDTAIGLRTEPMAASLRLAG
jgi:magnesium chelatase family protein